MKIQALFISDVHLGSKGSNDKELLSILKKYNPKHLFIVGDFIDGWLLKKRMFWPQSHTNVVQKILKMSKKGTKVILVTGNHDEFLREYTNETLGNIEIVDEYFYNDYFIVHGDKYDGIVNLHWLGKLGGRGYELAIQMDRFLKKLGFRVSLSKFLKTKVKEAVSFITRFETELIRQAKERRAKGVICGHIHKPCDKIIDEIRYLNCGDWIENNSYILHTEQDHFQLCFQSDSL